MEKVNKNILIGFLVFLLILLIVLWYKSEHKNSISIIDETLKCSQLYELKKERYWGNKIGQSKYIFSDDLNTCLALNIYSDLETRDYFAMVVDMSNDKNLLWYSDTPEGFYFESDQRYDCLHSYVYFEYFKGGKKVKEYGCEKYELMDKMFERVRLFGFKVFDGLSEY